jgi:hypothetical protein
MKAQEDMPLIGDNHKELGSKHKVPKFPLYVISRHYYENYMVNFKGITLSIKGLREGVLIKSESHLTTM